MNELHALPLLLAALYAPALVERYDYVPYGLARAVAATAGTLAVAYGGREVLRALGGGYYCCSHAYYATAGAVLVLVGWVALLPALGIVEPRSPIGGTGSTRRDDLGADHDDTEPDT